MDKLKQALVDGDAEALKRAAHSLKGEVSYLSAEDVSKTAREIERMAEENDLSQGDAMVQSLEIQLSRLYDDMNGKTGVYQ